MIAFIFNAFDKLPFFKQLFVTFGFIAIIIVVLYLTWKLKIKTDKLKNYNEWNIIRNNWEISNSTWNYHHF